MVLRSTPFFGQFSTRPAYFPFQRDPVFDRRRGQAVLPDLQHDEMQRPAADIAVGTGAVRRNADDRSFGHRKDLAIDLEFALAGDEQINLLVLPVRMQTSRPRSGRVAP